MHTNWCVLIEISMEIGMLNFWLPLLVTAQTKENYFSKTLSELKMLGHRIKYWPSKLLQPYFWYFCTNCIICNFKLVQCYLLCRYNARVVKMAERTVLMTLKTDIAKFEDRSIITFVKPTNAAQLKLATNPHLLLPSPQSCISQVLQKYAYRNILDMFWHAQWDLMDERGGWCTSFVVWAIIAYWISSDQQI